MHPHYSITAALLLTLASSASAFAQGTPAPAAEPRMYIAAIGGAVSNGGADPVFGVEFAEHLGRHAQAYVTISYFENLMRGSLRDALDATAERLSTVTGDDWNFTGRDRGIALVAGAKYVFGSGSIRPYVGAGAGVINLKRIVFDSRVGDVTQALYNDFDLGDAAMSTTVDGINRPLVEAAFGVGIGSGPVHFDIGYRYRSAYRTATSLKFSQIAGGIGYRF